MHKMLSFLSLAAHIVEKNCKLQFLQSCLSKRTA